MNSKWVNLTPSVPTLPEFDTTGGLGPALCIDRTNARPYILIDNIAIPLSGEIINIKAFGATGDGITVDYPAFVKAQTYIAAVARSGYGYNIGVPSIFVPFGVYNFAGNPFDIVYPIRWFAEGDGGGSNASTVLKWNNTSSGLRNQFVNTTGDSGTQAPTTHSGSGSIWQGFHFEGGFTNGVEGEFHAVHARAKILLRNCNFFNWGGDAIHVDADTSGAQKGNANITKSENCWADNCRNAWWAAGGDTNAGTIIGISANLCRRWGIMDGSFLGNQVLGGHMDSNGRTAWNTGATDHPCSYVYQTGNWYFAIHGQEAGASVNAPSGTTADNTWWGWWQAAGAADPGTGIPQWFNGIVVRSGGPILITGLNNNTTVSPPPHIEATGVSQIDQRASIFGGGGFDSNDVVSVVSGVLNRNRANRWHGFNDGMTADGSVVIKGDTSLRSISNFIGPIIGTQDGATYLESTNFYHFLNWRVSGGAVHSFITGTPASGLIYSVVAGLAHTFDVNSANVAIIDTNSINLASGKVLSVNSAQVVAARKTGWAVATGTATRTTFDTSTITLPQLAERIKALIDDLHSTAGHGLIGT